MTSTVFRRCSARGCGMRFEPRARQCSRCGSDSFSRAFIADVGRDASGRRRQRRRGGFTSKAEAERARRELLGRVDTSTYVDASRSTVADYVRRWLEGIRVKPTTVANYRTSAESYAIPRIGGLELRSLTAEHLDVLYRELEQEGGRGGQGLAPKTVRHVHTMLRKAFQDAVDRGHLPRNSPTWSTLRRSARPAQRPREIVCGPLSSCRHSSPQ